MSKTPIKIGFTCGCFDLMHAGHVKMLRDARFSACDRLVVAIQRDPSVDRPDTKNKPIQPYEDRIEMVKSCRWVDETVLYNTEEELYNLLQDLNPDVRILGDDYIGKPFTGDDLGIEIYYHARDHNMSTSEMRRLIYIAESAKRKSIKTA